MSNHIFRWREFQHDKTRSIRLGFFIALSALVLLGIASFSWAQPRRGGPPGRSSIVFFDRTNFRGNSANYNAAVARLNNRAQSVRIQGGPWELCDGRNFTGRCITLRSSASDLSRFNLNNGAISARPAGRSGAGVPSNWSLVLFDRTDFRGNAAKFSAQASNINRPVRSVTIGRGVWELCDGRDFRGRCVTLDRSVSDMGPWDVSLRISSLRPLTRGPR
jgi:hypothetical protein